MRVIRHNLSSTGYDPAAALHLGTVTLSYRSMTEDGRDATETVHFRCALPLAEQTAPSVVRDEMLRDALSNLTMLLAMRPSRREGASSSRLPADIRAGSAKPAAAG